MYAMNVSRLSFIVTPILVSVLLLAGCTVGPQQLGLSQSQWQSMDKTRQQKLVSNYNQIKQVKVNQTVYNGPTITVSLKEGTAMMPPFLKPHEYLATSFSMKPGQCRSIRLKSADNSGSVSLRACYNGLVLVMDPSHYDPAKSAGTMRFPYNPIWRRGFTYTGVSSSGYVRLNQATINVKAVPDMAPVQDVSHNPRV